MMGLGFQELLIVGVVAILLFGKRLPEVAKSLGKHYRDLQNGLKDLRSQVDFTDAYNQTPSRSRPKKNYADDDYEEASAPKFIPPPAEPPTDPPTNSAG
jgi:sec-independent protein translocase protein TatA